jgi:phage terminase large subunit-like protein
MPPLQKRKTPPTNSSQPEQDRATAYARSVASGARVAGPAIRNACARHLKDLVEGPARGLTWDIVESEKAIRFFENVLRLNGGRFEGEPFKLLGWQDFVVGCTFGWKGTDGTRRFRVVYVETGKGSGKSPLAAGIGLKGLVADGEARAEVYAAATKKDQAMILFRDAVAMVNQSPDLLRRISKSGVGEKVWNLAFLQTGSFFRPISSDDGQSGPRPHIALIDEVHEHKTNIVVEMMRAGTKSRMQALIFLITNSGSNKLGPCWGYHQYGTRVCSGELVDDGFFAFICDLDPEDDPFRDEACWLKSNPSLQDADLPGLKYLREQVTEARGMPSKEAIVRRLNFCQWTDAESPWISADIWKAATRSYDWNDFRGRRVYAGLDLSSTTDLTGLVLWVEPVEPLEPWRLVPFAWLPDSDLRRKAEHDLVPYVEWVASGHLETTPGRAISKLIVLQRLSKLTEFFEVVDVAYDRWRIEDLLQLASDEGITLPSMSPFGQGYKDMSPAIENFERLLLNGEVVHPGNPVLNWCATNAVTVADDAENRKLSKEKAVGRIDLIVAAVMGAGRIFAATEKQIVLRAEDCEIVSV